MQEPLDLLVSQGNKDLKDHLDPEDRQDLREQRVMLEQPVAKVQMDSRDLLDNLGCLDRRVHQEPKETKDQQEEWAPLAPRAQRAVLDCQATEELKDQQDFKDNQEIVVALVAVERPEMQEHLDLPEALVIQGPLVPQVPQEIAVHQGQLAQLGNQAHKDLKGNPDLLDLLEQLGRMEL
jgi:hypothetical protein